MTLKLGSLILVAATAATMSAQEPTVVQDIYSQSGYTKLESGQEVAYSFGEWYTGGQNDQVSLTSALFDEMIAASDNVGVDAVFADAEGIEISWNSVDKVITVKCDADKLGRTSVLIADINGGNRGMMTVDQTPAHLSIANHVAGTYVVAVAVDGKLVKSFKIILK